DERASVLSQHAFASVTKLVESLRDRRGADSAQEQSSRAAMLGQGARQLAEMGLVERAEDAFDLAALYHRSAKDSLDFFQAVLMGVVQTKDEETGDRNSSVVSRIARRCDYVEGFAHSGRLEVVQAHVEAVMSEVRLLKTIHHRDEAMWRIGRMLGYIGRWA